MVETEASPPRNYFFLGTRRPVVFGQLDFMKSDLKETALVRGSVSNVRA